MILNYDKYSTRQLADILREAHNSAYGSEKRMFGSPREAVISELERCLFITTLKMKQNAGIPKGN